MGIGEEQQYEQLQLDLKVGQDFTIKDYADFIHPEDDAYITVATKIDNEWKEKSYKTEEWLQNVKIASNTNSYNSVNTFYIPKRENNNVRHLNAFYVDLDIYNKGISKDQAIEQIDFLIRTERIPTPTFVIDSGRGLYAIWKINSVPGKFKNVQKLYGYIQGYLIQTTEEIGSDPQASDMARVLRTPGTYNTKSNSIVKILRSEDVVYAMRYLQEFMNGNIGYDQEIIDKRNEKKKKQKKTKKQIRLARLFNFYTLAIAREQDLQKLCELRNYDVFGFGNTIIYMYAYQVMLIEKSKHIAREKTQELNDKFLDCLSDKEIREITDTVYRRYKDHLEDSTKGYNYRNETIVKKLKITATEQKEMQTLISQGEKRQRDYSARRKNRRNKNGLTPKQQEIQERRSKVKELHKKGLNQTQISKELYVTRRTVYNDLNA